MKLEMSLPERPGWIFVLPGFDFVALLLALVMLSGVVAQESYVEVKLPQSESSGVRLDGERPVIIMLKSTTQGPAYFMDGKKVEERDLEKTIQEAAEKRETKRVAIEVDRAASTDERFHLISMLAKLDLKILDGYRRDEAVKEGE